MERKTIGSWLRQALGGRGGATQQGKNAAGLRVGMQVMTLDGTVLGTISALWLGADATDHAAHEDTLGVVPAQQDEQGLLFVPSTAVGRVAGQNVTLTVDQTQMRARGWQYRPTWLPADTPGDAAPAGTA
jgi:hypothetical protein